ncbi:hypothetical protein GCM10020219_023280 [Nonomuraea dietziae]
MWITNAGVSEYYHGHGRHRPLGLARARHLRLRRRESDEGVSFGPKEKKLGIKASPTRQVILENVRIPVSRMQRRA